MRSGRRGWTSYGAKRAKPTATHGKSLRDKNGSNKPIRSRPQPTATVQDRMVRRGSTVRVRQRALQNPRRSRGISVQKDLLFVARAVGMEPFMELFAHATRPLPRQRGGRMPRLGGVILS